MNPSSERILLLYVIETPLASKQYRVRAGAGMCVVNPRPQAGVGENSDALDDECSGPIQTSRDCARCPEQALVVQH